MKNKIIILVLLIIFIAGLIFINTFLNQYTKDNINSMEELSGENVLDKMEELEIKEENGIEKEENKMNIIELTAQNFEEEVLKSKKTVLIDFYADWCGPCKMMAPIIEKIASEQTEVKVGKINIDNEERLAIKYGVMSIPTFIVIKNGEEVNRIVGYVDKSVLEEAIK